MLDKMGNRDKTIDNFMQYGTTGWLKDFYRSLYEEKRNNKWDVLVLVTRKGFWIYKIITDYLGIKVNETEDCVFTDRYLMKSLDPTFIRGKKVCLVDDTVSRGHGLFHHYCVMKCLGAINIYPYIYAISTEFPSKEDDEEEQMLAIAKEVYKEMGKRLDAPEKLYKEFLDCTRGFRYMSQNNISRFCINETELFQQLLCPMVVNLPMMVSKPDGEVMKDQFVLDESTFKKLCEGSEEWNYVRNVYESVRSANKIPDSAKGYLNYDVISDYLYYTNSLVEWLKRSFLQNMVIKCKYNIDQNEQYHIAFTPFAIVRSIEKKEIETVFQILFPNDSKYKKKLMDRLSVNRGDSFAWTAMLRAVVYLLSRYVGEKFKKFLETLGIEYTGYDEKIVKYNSESQLIEEINLMDVVARCDALLEYNFRPKKKILLNEGSAVSASMPEIYETVHQMVLRNNGENCNDCLEIDELEEKLSEQFAFASHEEFEKYVTRIILLMLEISVFGNYLKIDGEIIRRGFRHGENSKLLLPERGIICYIFSEVLYMMAGSKTYSDHLPFFLKKAKEYLIRREILSQDNHVKAFEFYCDYFVLHAKEAEFYILGKEFIFEQLDEQKEKIRDYAIKLVEECENVWEEDIHGNE